MSVKIFNAGQYITNILENPWAINFQVLGNCPMPPLATPLDNSYSMNEKVLSRIVQTILPEMITGQVFQSCSVLQDKYQRLSL